MTARSDERKSAAFRRVGRFCRFPNQNLSDSCALFSLAFSTVNDLLVLWGKRWFSFSTPAKPQGGHSVMTLPM